MDRPATAREIILEIVRNMREGLEPMHYRLWRPPFFWSTSIPTIWKRLRAIVPRIVEEARRALDEELERLNKASIGERLKLTRGEPKISLPDGGWQIRILENTDDDVAAGDLVIYSELALPSKPELGAGSMTKRIATRRMGGVETAASSKYEKAQRPPAEPQIDGTELAIIEYEDNGGRKTFRMTRDQIVVGRGGRDYWTDLKLDTLPDVSREHFRLRRDPQSGEFFSEGPEPSGHHHQRPKSAFQHGFHGQRKARPECGGSGAGAGTDWPGGRAVPGIQKRPEWLRRSSGSRARATPAGCAAITKTRFWRTRIAASSWWSMASADRRPEKSQQPAAISSAARLYSFHE